MIFLEVSIPQHLCIMRYTNTRKNLKLTKLIIMTLYFIVRLFLLIVDIKSHFIL